MDYQGLGAHVGTGGMINVVMNVFECVQARSSIVCVVLPCNLIL